MRSDYLMKNTASALFVGCLSDPQSSFLDLVCRKNVGRLKNLIWLELLKEQATKYLVTKLYIIVMKLPAYHTINLDL